MSNIMLKIKNSKGYVSVEVIVVTGLILCIGVIGYMAFQNKSDVLINSSMHEIESANDRAVINKPFK